MAFTERRNENTAQAKTTDRTQAGARADGSSSSEVSGVPSNGWTPVLAVVSDGARRVLQVVDWTAGTGTKPAVGLYVAVTGLTAVLADGVDIRGGTGLTGATGATGLTGATGPAGSDAPASQARSTALTVLTAGSPADIGTISMPAGVTRWAVKQVWFVSVSASGTLALATFDVRTASAGGGVSIMTAPVNVSTLTAADIVQAGSVVDTVARTATTLHVRQTVSSLNAGTVIVALDFVNLS